MVCVSSSKVFELTADTVEYLYSKYDLNEPGRKEVAVKILQDWIKSQPHLKKKDFPPPYLLSAIIICKGSLERAKVMVDKLCTLRSLMPTFFEPMNVAKDLGSVRDKFSSFLLRKMTKEHYRVYFIKMHSSNFSQTEYMNFLKFNVAVGEFVRLNDLLDGVRTVIDLSDINIVELVAKTNILSTRKLLTILQDGFGMRLKSLHIITESTIVGSLLGVLKKALSAKIFSRIQYNKSISEIYDLLDRKTLPKEYGGEELTIQELKDNFIEVLSSEKHLQHLREMSEAKTDESLRVKGQFNKNYAGLPGTFRFLHLD